MVHPRALGRNPLSFAVPKTTRPAVRDGIYRGRVFDAEFIELCVRWYIIYRMSYRDLMAVMAERGVAELASGQGRPGYLLIVTANAADPMAMGLAAGTHAGCFSLNRSART